VGQTASFGRRYRGPLTSANGGYAAGTLASFVDADAAEVTLRLPPPLERPLDVRRLSGALALFDGDDVVAEARAANLAVEPPQITPEEAAAASERHVRLGNEAFSECFSCGIRNEHDGLEIHPGPVPEREPLHAAPWIAREVDPAVIWAAIDCTGAYALRGLGRGDAVLGRMTARIERFPEAGEPCVVVGWPLEEDGRKLHAATALLGNEGEPLALARQVWIAPRSAQVGNPHARIPDAQDP
jgi:hypothetical protein